MSDLNEHRVRCASCGRNVPAMKYCIYCGARLSQAVPPTISPRPTQTAPPPSLPPKVPPPQPPSVKITAPAVIGGPEAESASLMSNISTSYERKAALLDMFRTGGVTEGIFLKLYNEYSGKLSDLLNARIRRIDEHRSRLDEANRRLAQVNANLEELGVRHKIGEIDLGVFAQKADRLKMEQQGLMNSVKTFRMNLDRLGKMLSEKKPSEIRDLETKMRTNYEALQKLLGEGKISAQTLNAIKSDVEETLAFFNSQIVALKEKEKSLTEQLEVLQTRYKLSEISIEEYEKRKSELQAEIDKVWA